MHKKQNCQTGHQRSPFEKPSARPPAYPHLSWVLWISSPSSPVLCSWLDYARLLLLHTPVSIIPIELGGA